MTLTEAEIDEGEPWPYVDFLFSCLVDLCLELVELRLQVVHAPVVGVSTHLQLDAADGGLSCGRLGRRLQAHAVRVVVVVDVVDIDVAGEAANGRHDDDQHEEALHAAPSLPFPSPPVPRLRVSGLSADCRWS